MDSVLSIICIIFFAILIHYLIKGYNKLRHHKYDCKVIYIPEDIDIETAMDMVTNATEDELKKRALTLGASQKFVDESSREDIKLYIIQNSISEEHIMATEISKKIKEIEIEKSRKRQESRGENIRINKDQLNTNITLKALQEDFNE